jgi:hypothetical protein
VAQIAKGSTVLKKPIGMCFQSLHQKLWHCRKELKQINVSESFIAP